MRTTMNIKIQCVSDLHLDINDRKGTTPKSSWEHPDADLVAVVGDVGNGADSIWRLREIFPNKPIVMVAGNHDFYGLWWHNAIDLMREQAKKHDIVFLENESWEFGGVQFHGCTLWTDFDVYGIENRPYLMRVVPGMIADFQWIGVAKDDYSHAALPKTFQQHLQMGELRRRDVRSLEPQDVIDRHWGSRKWLAQQMTTKGDRPTVVLTHHLPHPMSVADQYKNSASNGAFVSNCEELFDLPGSPDFWLHGHTHSPVKYTKGRTMVSCNPMGYPMRSGGMENPQFNRQLLIEVPVHREQHK
jgi:predicted phosphodiesterase